MKNIQERFVLLRSFSFWMSGLLWEVRSFLQNGELELMTHIQDLNTACFEMYPSMFPLQPKHQNAEKIMALLLQLENYVSTEFARFSRDMANNITVVQVALEI